MLAVVDASLLTSIESGAFAIKVVEVTSPVNRSTKRDFEMVLVAEGQIIGWVGCWKRADGATISAGAPRVWMNDVTVHFFPGAGMEGGFSVEVETPEKAEHLATRLQIAFDEVFDSINLASVRPNRLNSPIRFQ